LLAKVGYLAAISINNPIKRNNERMEKTWEEKLVAVE
jgi:hypothetical protein